MRYRRFGRTQLPMPVFSCGGMRYQHKWEDVAPEDVPKANQENLEAVIHRALELGINHIETARGYGSSEMQLGWVLPKLPREKIIVQTKVGPSADPHAFLENFNKSLNYLGLEYVDLLGLHGINTPELLDWSVRKGGCMDAARQLQREGRVRFIGFSTHAPLEVILAAVRTGEFDYVNLHWYFINQHNLPAIQDARRQDMGVFIISPNDKGGMLYKPSPKLAALCAPLSPMAFNDLFCLSQTEVHTLSLGAARPGDFDEHIGALEHYDDIDRVVAPVRARLEAEMVALHGRDWVDHWQEGIPPQLEVPGGHHLWEILRIWTHVKAFDMTEFGKSRYNMFGGAGHWFPGHKLDNADWSALRRAVDGSPFPDRVIEMLREAHKALRGEDKKRMGSD